MATPGDDIDAFLESSGTADPQRLDVAIVFARSMFRELRASAAEWEATAAALEDVRRGVPRVSAPRHRFGPSCPRP